MLKARFEFKLQDMWTGVFWKRAPNQVDLWICLVPCIPLHVTLNYEPVLDALERIIREDH